MLEKLDFAQIVRYLFSGMVAAIAIAIWTGTTVKDVLFWRMNNSWVTDAGSITIVLGLLLFLGYVLFTFYRGLVYPYCIVWLKDLLGKICGVRTYREYIQDLFDRFLPTSEGGGKASGNRNWFQKIKDFVFRTPGGRLSAFEAERFYALIKITKDMELNIESGPQITTGLHFLYYTAIALLIGMFGRPFELLRFSFVLLMFTVFFFFVLRADWHFERLERLLFMSKQDKLKEAIEKLGKAGAYEGRVCPANGSTG